MPKISRPSRLVAAALSAAVLWTSPGLAAHAAAATIARAVVPAEGLSGSFGAGVSAPLAASMTAPLAAPSLSAFPAVLAPLSAVPAAPAAVSAAAPTVAVAAPALASLPAAADSGPRPALDSARSAASAAADGASSSRLARLFDGALSYGLGAASVLVSGPARLASSFLPSAADGPGFEPPTFPGRARVSIHVSKALGKDANASVRRLEQIYGFRADAPAKNFDDRIVLIGTVATEHVLALSRSKDVLELEVISGAPAPSSGPGFRAAATRLVKAVTPAPAREPFVAATRRVAELQKLAQSDPEKAYALAVDYLSTSRETRREVRFAALRVLDVLPLSKVLPFYQKTLETYADARVQNAKAAGADPAWYIQRHVLGRYAKEAETLKSDAAAVAAAKAAYADRSASVRLAAGAALRAMGVDPGPENEYLSPSLAKPADDGPFATGPETGDSQIAAYHDPASPPAPGFGKRLKKAAIWATIVGVLMFGIWNISKTTPPAPAPRPAVTQTVPNAGISRGGAPTISAAPSAAPSAPAAKAETPAASAPQVKPAAPTDHQLLEDIAKSEARIAKAQEDQVAAQKAAAQGGGMFSGLIGIVLNAVIFIGLFMLIGKLFRGGMGGGASNGGMSASTEAKANVEKPTQRFTDVEGVDEALVDVSEIVDFLRDPSRFVRMGAKAPKGILFEGPPGTGKTLMARALAGETNSAFFAVSGSDFVELFVGMGARRVRELIAKAADHRPAIVFIDEIDAVGKARGAAGPNGGNDEREQTINALLTGMDGFDNSGGIIFVAATNRAELLDPALTRPGRFDRKVHVGKPHMGGREAIAVIHAKGKRLAPELDLAYVARRTAGLAGADIEGIMNEAALQAVRRGADAIGMADIDEAIDRGTIGASRNLPMPEALKKRVAYHEAGHVLANMLNEDPALRRKVTKFTIVPHGSGALGFAEIGDEEGDRYLYTKEELEARIDHALGGLVAEKLIFGRAEKIPAEFSPDWSTGPGSDLEVATRLARAMVQTLGMGEETGLAVTAPDPRDPMGRAPFGDAVGERTWRETNKILAASYKRVTARLTRNRHVLESLTKAVLEKETLIGDEVEDVVRRAKPIEPPVAPKN